MTPVIQTVGRLDRWASLFKQRQPAQRCRWRVFFCRRFTSLQQTRLVSLDADRSRRNRYAPRACILTFCRYLSNGGGRSQRRRRSFMARSISRSAVLRAISRRLSYCFLRLATASSSLILPFLG